MYNKSLFINFLAKWEYKNKMFQYKINNVEIWNYIRYDVGAILEYKVMNSKTIPPTCFFQNSNKKRTFLVSLIQGLLNNPILFKQSDLLFMNHNRREKINGYYISPFIDDLLENLKHSYCVLEQQGLQPIKTKNIYYYDPSAFYRTKNHSDKTTNKINKLINMLEKSFKTTFTEYEKNKIETCIKAVLSNRNILKTYYRFILTQIRPKIIFLIPGIHEHNLYMIEIAKEMGIVTIELGHGVYTPYSYDVYYYKKMNINTFPDYFMCYSIMEKESIQLPINNNNIIVIGNSYNERRVNESLIDIQSRKNKKETILVISDGIKNSKLDELAIDLSKILDPNKYRIEFKIRPSEDNWRTKYAKLNQSNVFIVGNTVNDDIYYYLSQASYVISTATTVLFEAVSFPIKIFVYKNNSYKNSEYLYKNGYASLVTNAKEIYENVISHKNTELYKSSSKLFLPNSKYVFEKEISCLMKVIKHKNKKSKLL